MHQNVNEPFSFVSYPKFIVTWVLVLVGFILCILHWIAPGTITENVIGTVWLTVLIFTLLAIGLDFNFARSAVIFLVVSVLFLALGLLATSMNVPIFSPLLRFLRLRNFGMSGEAILGISLALGFILTLVVVFCQLNHKWVVIQGRMERRVFGIKAEEWLISSPNSVTYEIPDVMDSLLTFLGGYLIVRRSGQTLREIGLVFRVRIIDQRIDVFESVPTEEMVGPTALPMVPPTPPPS